MHACKYRPQVLAHIPYFCPAWVTPCYLCTYIHPTRQHRASRVAETRSLSPASIGWQIHGCAAASYTHLSDARALCGPAAATHEERQHRICGSSGVTLGGTWTTCPSIAPTIRSRGPAGGFTPRCWTSHGMLVLGTETGSCQSRFEHARSRTSEGAKIGFESRTDVDDGS